MGPITVALMGLGLGALGGVVLKRTRAQLKKRREQHKAWFRAAFTQQNFEVKDNTARRISQTDVLRVDFDPSSAHKLTLQIQFRPSLDLGLMASSHPQNSPFEIAFTNDNEFAARYEVIAINEHRARALFDDQVRHALRKKQFGSGSFKMTDRGATIELFFPFALNSSFAQQAQWVVELAELFAAARAKVPPAKAFAAERFEKLGKARGWLMQTAPLHLKGPVEAASFEAYASIERSGLRAQNQEYPYHYEENFHLSLTLTDPLELGLQIWPKRWSDHAVELLGGQDVQTDDERFDEVFRVKARDTEGAKKLLDPSVRAALTAVLELVPRFDVNDRGLTLQEDDRGKAFKRMSKLLPVIERLASAIESARTTALDRAQGPYR